MALATSAQTALADIAEVTWGTTPSGALSETRVISETLEFKKGSLESEEIKLHRQVGNVIHGSHTVEGELTVEFNNGMDRWLEAACGSVFSTGVLKIGQLAKSFTVERRCIGVGWNFKYQGVKANGFTLDLKPEAIATMTIPIVGKTLAAPTADALNGPSGYLINNVAGYPATTTTVALDTGTTSPASGDQFVIYAAASTTTQRSEQIYTVASYGAPNLTFSPGLDVAILDNDILHFVKPATVVSSDDPANGFSGAITEGGSALAIATSITMEHAEGIEAAKVIGANQAAALTLGKVAIKGTLNCYVLNATLFNKFHTEGYTTLQFALTSGANTYTFLLPKVKYMGASLAKATGGGYIVQGMPFVAVYDGSETTALKITKT